MNKAMSLIGVCAAAFVAAAGCGVSIPKVGGGPYDGPHACQLLTAALAQSVLGSGAHLERSARPNPRETQCVYTSSTGAVSVETGNWDEVDNPSVQALNPRPVSGIGDEASISFFGLVVRKRDRGIDVDVKLLAESQYLGGAWVSSGSTPHPREAEADTKLATQLIAKL